MAGADQRDRAGCDAAAVFRDPGLGTGTSQFAVIQAAAPSLRMEVSPINMRDAGEIEQSVEIFARAPNGGLIVAAGGVAQRHRDLLIGLAARISCPPSTTNAFLSPPVA